MQVQQEVVQEGIDRDHETKRTTQDGHFSTPTRIKAGEGPQDKITLQVPPWVGGKPNCRASMVVERGLRKVCRLGHSDGIIRAHGSLSSLCSRNKKLLASLLGARTLLGAPGIATRSKKLLGALNALGISTCFETWHSGV